MPVDGMNILCVLPPDDSDDADHQAGAHGECEDGEDCGAEEEEASSWSNGFGWFGSGGSGGAGKYSGKTAQARIVVWKNAMSTGKTTAHTHYVLLPGGTSRAAWDMDALVAALASKLGFVKRDSRRPTPALYNQDGAKLLSLQAVAGAIKENPVLCFSEGGVWVWPPGPIGTVREVKLADDRVVTLTTLSDGPVVIEISGFLAPDEASRGTAAYFSSSNDINTN